MNVGDIEKLKGIYADDFATLGSLSKIITKQNLEAGRTHRGISSKRRP
jgi:hypothetical protein